MDAVEFLKEVHRMCESFTTDCSECPLNSFYCASLTELSEKSKEVVPLVEKWSKDHPRKTRLQDFLEKYPNAVLKIGTQIPNACAKDLGYCESCVLKRAISGCYSCWNEPVED